MADASSVAETVFYPKRPDVMLFQRIDTIGGAELSMFRVLEDLQTRGMYLKSAFYGPTAREVARSCPGLNAEVIPVNRTRNVILPLARLLRRERPRVLLSVLTMTNCAAAAGTFLAGTSTRLVQTEHQSVLARFRYGSMTRVAYLRLLRASYWAADAVVAVSSDLALEISAITRDRVRPRVIYNPVVDKGPKPCDIPPHPWLLSSDPPCIISVGRLTPQKDYISLIRAFAHLARTRACRLIILGEGEERTKLEQLCRELDLSSQVLLPGFVNTPSDWLQYASLYVCSSVYEGFGNAIVEAMECGIPVVSTDCSFGPSEILEGGRLGRLVAVGRVDLLADAMAAGLGQSVDREALRARAANFSRARAADSYANLISEFD